MTLKRRRGCERFTVAALQIGRRRHASTPAKLAETPRPARRGACISTAPSGAGVSRADPRLAAGPPAVVFISRRGQRGGPNLHGRNRPSGGGCA
eukprot:365299-Chlamydomonas_euryale.AAC.9